MLPPGAWARQGRVCGWRGLGTRQDGSDGRRSRRATGRALGRSRAAGTTDPDPGRPAGTTHPDPGRPAGTTHPDPGRPAGTTHPDPGRPAADDAPGPGQARRDEPGPEPPRTDKRRYFVLMGVCIALFVLSWAVVDRYSVLAAVIMSAVALVIPPLAAIVANVASATDRRRP